MDIKRDLAAICGVLGLPAKSGKHKCPFHADRNPSLSVRQSDSGVWLWKCFSGCGGGTIVDALAHKRNISTEQACVELGAHAPRPRQWRKVRGASVAAVDNPSPIPKALRIDAALRAIDDVTLEQPDFLLAALRRRGLTLEAIQRLRIAYFDEVNFLGRRGRNFEELRKRETWLIPITAADGRILAVKTHCDAPSAKGDKAGWLPVGKFIDGQVRHGLATLWPSPESYDLHDELPALVADWPTDALDEFEQRRDVAYGHYGDLVNLEMAVNIDEQAERETRKRRLVRRTSQRPLLLCPGELKAAAIISAGMDATSITAGESHKWTTSQVKRLEGRNVFILYDDDPAGLAFRNSSIAALKCACPYMAVVTLGKMDGRKIDANDIGREFGPHGLRVRLDALLATATNLHEAPFDLATHRDSLSAAVDAAINADDGVHLFRSVVGSGKSRAVCEKINANPAKKFVIFVSSHKLAKEYETAIPGALRIVSPEAASRDGLITDENGKATDCPALKIIKTLRTDSVPYTPRTCASCPLRPGCAVMQQKSKIDEARVLILQHAHLRALESVGEKWCEGRVRIIDESCLADIRWSCRWTDEKMDRFDRALVAFGAGKHGAKHGAAVRALRAAVDEIRKMPAGSSFHPPAENALRSPQRLLADWGKFMAANPVYNLLPDLVAAIRLRAWVRCMIAKDGLRGYWTIRGALPDMSQPLLILDATAALETYRALFGADRDIRVWPDCPLPAPQSDVVQFIDGLYPAASLLDKNGPSACFEGIVQDLRRIVEHKRIAWKDVGVITLKKLTGVVGKLLPDLPPANVLHYGHLRGLNDIKDARLVALIGCQPPPDWSLAWSAATLHALDIQPETLLGNRGRKLRPVATATGDGYEVEAVDLADARLNLAWAMAVTAELEQAVGRARPHEPRAERQTVLIWCNQPLVAPVTRAMPRHQYLRELGLPTGASAPTPLDRATDAMKKLRDGFGYAELAAAAGVGETTIKSNARWKAAVAGACVSLGLEFKRTGDGATGSFLKSGTHISELSALHKNRSICTADNSEIGSHKPLLKNDLGFEDPAKAIFHRSCPESDPGG